MVIVPPESGYVVAIEVTLPVPHVEHAIVIGAAPKTTAPAVIVITPVAERVVVGVVNRVFCKAPATATPPCVQGVEVPRPPNVSVPVVVMGPPKIGKVVAIEVMPDDEAVAHLGTPFNWTRYCPFVP